MDKGIQKIADKYIQKCPQCGKEFYPWKTLMVTLPQNDMRPFLYCPNCKYYNDMEAFKKN